MPNTLQKPDPKLLPWREDYLVFGQPCIGEAERKAVNDCIDSLWLGSGPRVQQFEQEFASYLGSPYAVAVNSGTAALELALKVLDLEPGSEVLVPSLTFCATANAVIHSGLTPVFVDSKTSTLNIDVEDCKRKITEKTSAIIPVHFAGRPCEMDEILSLANNYGLKIVEDCAHAIESTHRGVHCGNFGDIGCFSFYVTKNITTVEGGMVVCKSEEQANRIKIRALHGMSKDAWNRFSDEGYIHYQVVDDGYKYNMTDIAASFGIEQLRKIEQFADHRKLLWEFYLEQLVDLPLDLPQSCPKHVNHAHHLFTCLLKLEQSPVSRDQLLERMHQLLIGTGVHYLPLHLHTYYRSRLNLQNYNLPQSEDIALRTFSIPLSPAVSLSDAADVVRALKLILR